MVGGAKGTGATVPVPDALRPLPSPRSRWRRRAVALVVSSLAVLLAYPAWNGLGLWLTWRSVERQTLDTAAFEELDSFDPSAAADLDAPAGYVDLVNPTATPTLRPTTDGADTSVADGDHDATGGDGFTTFMVVGSDLGGSRADVILLTLLPDDGSAPIMVSLPRDLYLPNRCTQGLTRLNANYNGCGDQVNGPTQLSGAVQDFTGLEVDHFALFGMEDFATIIDRIGGTDICVTHPVRDENGLDLPAGCSLADGETTLLWVRSRKTQELIDGRWRTMPGVSDLTRNQRQQDLILSMLSRAADFDSPGELTTFVHSLGNTFTLDDRLGLTDAVDLAWANRDLQPESFVRLTIPVEPYETSGGAQVLLPTASFADVLGQAR